MADEIHFDDFDFKIDKMFLVCPLNSERDNLKLCARTFPFLICHMHKSCISDSSSRVAETIKMKPGLPLYVCWVV